MGDIHGSFKGLKQCLERSGFNKEEDTLIQLGDVADGWNEVYDCVEELLTIKNLISIRGNHDEWFQKYSESGVHGGDWDHGGHSTAYSYLEKIGKEDLIVYNGIYSYGEPGGWVVGLNPGDIPFTHEAFFKHQIAYYIDEKNRLFIHGGFNRHNHLSGQPDYIFYWDRGLWGEALSYEAMVRGENGEHLKPFKMKDGFSEVYVGHTTTMNWGKDIPMKAANIWNLDTGAGFKGKLTIMNVDTKEYWQSDYSQTLYPDQKGRE